MLSLDSKTTGPFVMKIGIYAYFCPENVCIICPLMPLATRRRSKVATSAQFNGHAQ